ncbi:hypothetical protein JW868_02880 [Candidatus Woesearchaeota archaeon]|nr:hypothetical protein [Candidatus Woesearchaeota archaeon]
MAELVFKLDRNNLQKWVDDKKNKSLPFGEYKQDFQIIFSHSDYRGVLFDSERFTITIRLSNDWVNIDSPDTEPSPLKENCVQPIEFNGYQDFNKCVVAEIPYSQFLEPDVLQDYIDSIDFTFMFKNANGNYEMAPNSISAVVAEKSASDKKILLKFNRNNFNNCLQRLIGGVKFDYCTVELNIVSRASTYSKPNYFHVTLPSPFNTNAVTDQSIGRSSVIVPIQADDWDGYSFPFQYISPVNLIKVTGLQDNQFQYSFENSADHKIFAEYSVYNYLTVIDFDVDAQKYNSHFSSDTTKNTPFQDQVTITLQYMDPNTILSAGDSGIIEDEKTITLKVLP